MATNQITYERAAIVSESYKTTHYTASSTYNGASASLPDDPCLVCGPSSYPESIKYKELNAAYLYVYFNKDSGNSRRYIIMSSLASPFSEESVTYDSLSLLGAFSDIADASAAAWFKKAYSITNETMVNHVRGLVKNGVLLETEGTISTPKGSQKPYIELVTANNNAGVKVNQSYPIGSATISATIPTTFSWETSPETYKTLEPIVASKAVFRWRKSGASTYTEVNCSNPLQCTIPANTFSGGAIQWQVSVTANSGTVTTSDWMTTEVIEPTSSCVALSPVDKVLDGTVEQTFAWEHIISNGTAQHAFDLQISWNNGATWVDFRSETTSQTSTTFAPGTFSAGDLWWRVRTYNVVGVASPWSESKHCLVIAAPDAPSITADDTSPRFILRWQQTGQQAYELKVDGVTIAKTFSAESIYRHDGYLAPGTHKVQVRIQNCYQMWSDWGSATLQIVNTEGEAIQLSAVGENDVILNWTTSGIYDGYVVYRNGEKIAEAAATSYTDHFAVGEVTYQVRGVHTADGNYTLSNAVPVTITPRTLLIADISEPEWIKLPLSTASLRSAGLSASQTVTYTHYIGTGLPGAEIGEAVSRSYDLDCAFKATDRESIRRFESLLGKVVCIKTPSQRRIVGVLAQMTARETRLHVSYRAPIVEVRWEEMQE